MSDLTWTNEKRKLRDLIPWEHNPRQIKSDQARRLRQSWDEFGQVIPFAVGPDGQLYDGHQRKAVLELADKYGPDLSVDVRASSRPLTEDERKKLVVLLHKGAHGEWNFDALANWFDVDELLEWGFDEGELDLELWGLPEEPAEDPGAEIDRAEELREQWGVETGQLWQLGEHRLICGDALDESVINRLVDNRAYDLLLCDPPYDMDGDDQVRSLVMGRRPQCSYIIFGVFPELQDVLAFLPDDLRVSFDYVWSTGTTHMHPNQNYPMGKHKNIFYAYDGKMPILNKQAKKYLDINGIPSILNFRYSSTKEYGKFEKLVDLYEFFICAYSGQEWVADFFGGSGSSMIACENLEKRSLMCELSPSMCAVIIDRYSSAFNGAVELLED